MRVIIQRVSHSKVEVGENCIAKINKGLNILLGVEEADTYEDIQWLCNKIVKLRIFSDENDLMNLSIQDIDGDILVVSQFTLFASTKKGNRPSFIRSAKPEKALLLYEKFVQEMELLLDKKVQTGEFGAMMKVEIANDGPVTIMIDTKNRE